MKFGIDKCISCYSSIVKIVTGRPYFPYRRKWYYNDAWIWKQYDILKVNKALVKSVHRVKEHAICSLVFKTR